MPVVGVGRDLLFKALGQEFSEEEFEDLCFEYGIELDDVTSERKMLQKETQTKKDAQSEVTNADDEIIYRIDIPANRYDMMCLEGIARALKIFRRKQKCINYRLADMKGKKLQRMVVKPETALVRPFVVCAILRGVTLDANRYKSFIDLQDKLHQNLCRQRSLVAIGTHDLSSLQVPILEQTSSYLFKFANPHLGFQLLAIVHVKDAAPTCLYYSYHIEGFKEFGLALEINSKVSQGPFTYEALPPEEINFVPLKQTKSFNARDLLEHYQKNDLKLRRFVPLIQKSLVYPVLYDANRVVLSLPPIINSSHSQMSPDTKDVFVECTATDLAKAEIVLNTLCTMFSEYCSQPFEVEPVEVVDAFGASHIYPNLDNQRRTVDVKYINDCLGLELDAPVIADLLSRMALEAAPSGDGQAVSIFIPPTRTDVLHNADVMEDVAIAYGYNNMERQIPVTSTFGKELPLMQLTEGLRSEIKDYTESLTWALCSRAENFGFMNREDDGKSAVSIGNPATAEFEVCRTTLLPALLKTVAANKDAALPLKLFEVSDVILIDESSETGCRNERRLAAVHCSTKTEFEVIHGLLNRVMEILGVPLEGPLAKLAPQKLPQKEELFKGGYSWEESDSPSFFPDRHADILVKGKRIGEFGIIHPTVLQKFDIPNPVTALEINIEPFCFDQIYQPLQTHSS